MYSRILPSGMARVLSAVGVIVTALVATMALGYDNGRGARPPMGWNTWCTESDCHDSQFFDRCSEKEIKSIAEAMLSNGMHELGYDHINLDDCWGGCCMFGRVSVP